MIYTGAPYGQYSKPYGYAGGFVPILSRLPPLAVASSFARKLSNLPLPVATIRRDTDSDTKDLYGAGPHGFVPLETVRNFNGWNLLGYSNTFSNAAWTKSNSSIVSSTQLTDNVTSGSHHISQAPVATTGQVETLSVEAKAGTANYVWLFVDGVSVWFNLSTGAVGSSSGSPVSSTITAIGSGWHRCTITRTRVNASTTVRIGVSLADATTSYSGTGSYVEIRNAQFERASAFSTYEARSGVGAGNSFFTHRYDHSGNDRHWTQSSTSIQRYACIQGVVQSENGRLTSYGVAADARRMSIGSSEGMFNFLHTTGGTLLIIARGTDTAATKYMLSNKTSSSAAGIYFYQGATEAIRCEIGRRDIAGVATNGETVIASTSVIPTTNNVISALIDPDNVVAASRAAIYRNGVDVIASANTQTSSPFIENAAGVLTLGATPAAGLPWDGTLTEDLIYNGSLTTSQRQFYEQNAIQLWGLS